MTVPLPARPPNVKALLTTDASKVMPLPPVELFCRACEFIRLSEPAETVVLPVCVLAAVRNSVPAPLFVKVLEAPCSGEANVTFWPFVSMFHDCDPVPTKRPE